MANDWDVETYRTPFESIEHWSLKRDFMLAHIDKIPEDRLVCLAQVFANIELMGCKYPDAVMKEVSELAKDIGTEYKQRKKTILQRTFMQASDAAGAKIRGNSKKTKERQQTTLAVDSYTVSTGTHVGNTGACLNSNTSSTQSNQSCDLRGYLDEIHCKRKNTSKPSGGKRKDTREHFKPFSRGDDLGSKQQKCFQEYPSEEWQDTNTSVHESCSNEMIASLHNSGRNDEWWDSNDPLSEFIIVLRAYQLATSPIHVLSTSAQFSRLPVIYNFTNLKKNGSCCQLFINGVLVASVEGTGRAGKLQAAQEALNVLRSRCYTLKVLKLHSADGEVLLEEAGVNTEGHNEDPDALGDDNLGCKLLKMMGWCGGGLGKDGSGIIEPINPSTVINRQGLGMAEKSGISKVFTNTITRMVSQFAHEKGSGNDLAFSADFSKEQRAEIHRIARKFRLKSKSHGFGDGVRYLVLQHSFSAKQLIRDILQKGGSTDRYELIPPMWD